MKQSTALDILKTGANVFLTGSAGAGKTHVLRQYIQYLRAHKIAVAVTASTGIAATHMDGMTIHTWAGIGIKDEMSQADLKRLYTKKYLRDHLEKTEVLIIDEISMLHARQFNLVNQVLQYFKANYEPFGGMQIVVSGDFFQLPPVSKNNEANRDKFAFMSPAWVEAQFRICYLSQQYRQSDDALTGVLNAIRQQNIQPEHIDLLLSTQQQTDEISTKLYTHNADVDVINSQYLAEIEGKTYHFRAELQGNAKLQETLKSSVRAPELLELKQHAKVMFVKNNFEAGYVNGSLGEVTGFTEDIELGTLPEVTLLNGETVVAEPCSWSINDDEDKPLASLKQIPLRLAWAITVHKSQGMTLDQAEIDLSKTFECGQGYVALSRLKTLDGLKLVGFSPFALALDRLAHKADQRFQALSEEVEQLTQQLEPEQLKKQQQDFILRCGGSLSATDPNKAFQKPSMSKDTLAETRTLFEAGYDIGDIARERGLTAATIINHLTRLSSEQELDVERIRPSQECLDATRKAVKMIQKRANPDDFTSDNSPKLRPIVELSGLNYTEVRIALLFIL